MASMIQMTLDVYGVMSVVFEDDDDVSWRYPKNTHSRITSATRDFLKTRDQQGMLTSSREIFLAILSDPLGTIANHMPKKFTNKNRVKITSDEIYMLRLALEGVHALQTDPYTSKKIEIQSEDFTLEEQTVLADGSMPYVCITRANKQSNSLGYFQQKIITHDSALLRDIQQKIAIYIPNISDHELKMQFETCGSSFFFFRLNMIKLTRETIQISIIEDLQTSRKLQNKLDEETAEPRKEAANIKKRAAEDVAKINIKNGRRCRKTGERSKASET